ncbi:hypothetical protein AtNW77_Chr1g0035791 [Arabidopsis thaliana]|uniref:Uncharacterized protein n=2 Tax=Arabidopsis TaxID=3701 RepID=A0A178W6L9_ARATH|nr:hypothetical protein ISN45_At01g031810 [Arabidopsis thaliana x Arabidopsis arenosa]OAP14140.1 hypothetical protein AXX17_AT1G32720 [Arabidopsis thaliana]
METDSANNQKLPISGDETAKFSIYSSAVHKVVVMVSQHSSILETHKAAFLSFCVLVLFYAVLRVREARYVRLQPGLVPRLVGHASHLFGGLAALVLIYVVSAAFAMVLLVLWFLWLFTIVYKNFREVTIIYSEKYNSGTGLPQLPPV